jgi:hypothetical protein
MCLLTYNAENKCPGTVGSNGEIAYPAGYTNYRVAGAAGLTLPHSEGTCNEPSCDCVEFFNQAVKLYRGVVPGWFAAEMPTTQADATAMLSTEFKAAVDAKVGRGGGGGGSAVHVELGWFLTHGLKVSALWFSDSTPVEPTHIDYIPGFNLNKVCFHQTKGVKRELYLLDTIRRGCAQVHRRL